MFSSVGHFPNLTSPPSLLNPAVNTNSDTGYWDAIGNLLTSFILSRITDDTVGLGACAKGLLSLEQLGKWDNERVVEIMNTLVSCLFHGFENRGLILGV